MQILQKWVVILSVISDFYFDCMKFSFISRNKLGIAWTKIMKTTYRYSHKSIFNSYKFYKNELLINEWLSVYFGKGVYLKWTSNTYYLYYFQFSYKLNISRQKLKSLHIKITCIFLVSWTFNNNQESVTYIGRRPGTVACVRR